MVVNDEELKLFQDNMQLIRQLAGLTQEELGNQIGVTKQTINSIEKKKNKITKTQYIAMRFILKERIITFDSNSNKKKKNPDETIDILAWVLDAVVDNPQNYSDKDRQFLIERANILAQAIKNNVAPREQITNTFLESLKPIGLAVGVIVMGVLGFKGLIKK